MVGGLGAVKFPITSPSPSASWPPLIHTSDFGSRPFLIRTSLIRSSRTRISDFSNSGFGILEFGILESEFFPTPKARQDSAQADGLAQAWVPGTRHPRRPARPTSFQLAHASSLWFEWAEGFQGRTGALAHWGFTGGGARATVGAIPKRIHGHPLGAIPIRIHGHPSKTASGPSPRTALPAPEFGP